VFALIALALVAAPPKESPVSDAGKSKCVAEFHVDRGQSPWQGYTGSAAEEDAGRTLAAVADLSKFERPDLLAKFDVAGKALLAIDREKKRVVVNAEHFSELHRADVTRSGTTELGTVKSDGLRKDGRALVSFLVVSQVVQTLAHVESHVCLEKETDSPAEYRAHFKGTHVFFTNKRKEAPLDFDVVLDRKTGAVRVDAR